MEKSKAIPDKPSPFIDAVMGEWKPDKKLSNKDNLVFSRKAELDIAEKYAQDWIDPVSFKKKKVYGKVILEEHKIISKRNGDTSFERRMEPALTGGIVEDMI